jgi:asparagine N-glycosylation enzyme membrane subunit Stt3
LTSHLNQVKNEVGIPIYYVIGDPEQEDRYRADNGELGRRIYDAPFRGRMYETDAFQVLQIIRQWTSGGTAETFVDNNNDVQDTWTKLICNYEGHDARGANVQRSRETIASAHWTRNTHNFSFDDYCNRHKKANNELDCYGGNVDGESRVNAFLKGILTDPRTNPHLLPIKAIILNGETTKPLRW